ncbi:MAG: SH3 domain-containing protein [Clostridium sp.]|jgi:uncharacterized protein YraI|nr:SH3 domain-containing protein [Clostridium sp.]
MWKKSIHDLRTFLIKNGKIAIPIVVIAGVAITVFFALSAKSEGALDNIESLGTSTQAENSGESLETTSPGNLPLYREISNDPLEKATDSGIIKLVTDFFLAKADGDLDTIRRLRTTADETDELKILEWAKYIDGYPFLEIYTKLGPLQGSYIAFVYYEVQFSGQTSCPPGIEPLYICLNADGEYRINNMPQMSDEEMTYVSAINVQEDVKALYEEVNYSYMVALTKDETLRVYVDGVSAEVEKAVGEALALIAKENEPTPEPDPNVTPPSTEDPSVASVRTATATATVNIRSSDSAQADKVGSIPEGSTVDVLEQRANGWSQILFAGTGGFVKSEYLDLVPIVEGGEIIGTVTAVTNVNIRAAASETAHKLGVVTGGQTVNLISRENGWCKISQNGLIGYIKEEYVQ